MILSVSKRTDIPAFYPEWLVGRLTDKKAATRNPYNGNITRMALEPDEIDGIVFWSKNPARMLPYLKDIDALGYRDKYYFTFTINGYGPDLEPNLPDLEKRLETFIRLSGMIGKNRVIWRYDPIVITDKYTPEWHEKCFGTLCEILAPYTSKCVVSIVDFYEKTYPALKSAGFRNIQYDEKMHLFAAMADIAIKRHGLALATCAENMPELEPLGITENKCIDRELIEKITDKQLVVGPSNGRSHCGCCENVDIGSYDTCAHGCAYCYACKGPREILSKIARYDPKSIILCDEIRPGDVITDKTMYSHDADKIPF